IDISEKDVARWMVTTTCVPTQNHIFHNESSDKYCLLPDFKEYYWDFGDDTFKNKVKVFYNPVAGFKFSSDRGCKPLATTLTDTSKGRSYTRLWTVTEGG